MSDIFTEVEEDLRRERFKQLWQRYGIFVIALALLIVLGVAGWRGWEWWSARKAAEAGARFESAMQLAREGKAKEADEALADLAKTGPSGYAQLARFRRAAELGKRDSGAAVREYDAIAADANLPQLARDLAKLRAGLILLDGNARGEVTARVEALAQAGNPWRHSARELMAFAGWKAGDVAATRQWAEAIVTDAEAPPGARQRGQMLLDLAAGAPAPNPAPSQ